MPVGREGSDTDDAIVALRAALDDPDPALIAAAPADDDLLLALWHETPVARRRAFVEAVAAAGDAHLDALISGARRLVQVNRDQASPLMMMLSPYLADPTSGELLVESMLEHLRANRHAADPKRAELAERMLRRDDLWRKRDGSDD